ncbi:cytochrome P450 [Microbispora sp. NBRC 16548]|uniref:cytochrome P450 n=1 Tax=Microbispora sp. NBRC 16548 TaxID=3030994 RepID=UPI0024A5E483|nr:cytochrome P450 [Microbispora sp. NBRC 16548]GLX06641.1 cytochrome P450 [Microbispora sp. NBRC 16548]
MTLNDWTPPPGCPAHHAPGPVQLYGADYAADPHAVYARLRQYGPAAPVELAPGVHAVLVTSYRAALDVLRNSHLFSKDSRRWRALSDGQIPADHPLIPMMGWRPNCLFSDGSEHYRLRQAITDSLDRVNPHVLREVVHHSADRLITVFAGDGHADLISQYASGLPLLVLNSLFGLDDRYSDRLITAIAALFDSGDNATDGDSEFLRYVQDLITIKRTTPGPDITSWLMSHPAGLADEEVLHTCILIIAAGTEPVTHLIGNTLRLLLCDQRFAGNLFRGTLPISAALDEVLWEQPPMQNYAVHYPLYDVDMFGIHVAAGHPVVIGFAAANTDPDVHGGARTRIGNNAHLAWSAGPHSCPARRPARTIASAAIERLLDHLPDITLSVPAEQLTWRPGPFHRALNGLPVRFTPTMSATTSRRVTTS